MIAHVVVVQDVEAARKLLRRAGRVDVGYRWSRGHPEIGWCWVVARLPETVLVALNAPIGVFLARLGL